MALPKMSMSTSSALRRTLHIRNASRYTLVMSVDIVVVIIRAENQWAWVLLQNKDRKRWWRWGVGATMEGGRYRGGENENDERGGREVGQEWERWATTCKLVMENMNNCKTLVLYFLQA